MAEAGYGCVFGDCPKQFRYMITDITNGNTVTLCEEHYAPGLIPILGSELGVDPGDFYATVERYIKRQQAKADSDLAKAQSAKAVKSSKAPAASPNGGPAGDDHADDDEREETGLLHGFGEEAL
jgi:hypothetical protein